MHQWYYANVCVNLAHLVVWVWELCSWLRASMGWDVSWATCAFIWVWKTGCIGYTYWVRTFQNSCLGSPSHEVCVLEHLWACLVASESLKPFWRRLESVCRSTGSVPSTPWKRLGMFWEITSVRWTLLEMKIAKLRFKVLQPRSSCL